MKTRLILSILIFTALCALRAFFPEQVSAIRGIIVPAINSQASFRDDFIALGRILSGEADYIYVWEHGKSEENKASETAFATPSPSPKTIAPEVIQTAAPTPVPTPTPTPTPTPVPTPVPSPDNVRSAKVEAFLQSQSAFSDYAVPASVSYDTPQLPFEFTSPSVSTVSSGFGYREHPIEGGVKFHYGTDIAEIDGSDVYAFADGTVVSAQELDGYGLTVIIDHGSGFSTLYAHCSALLVEQGAKVVRGDKIALSGHSGRVTGPHLHFELIDNGKYLNPEFYL